MKKTIIFAAAVLFLVSCKKEITSQPNERDTSQLQTQAIASSAEKQNSPLKEGKYEVKKLVREWTEWIYTRPAASSPVNDPDGNWQYADQPYKKELFMLAGANDPNPIVRNVTIDISKYQYLFVPLVNLSAWYDKCDQSFAPDKGQKKEEKLEAVMNDAFAPPADNHLLLTWDQNRSLHPTDMYEFRAASDIWDLKVDPSWNTGSSYTNCLAPHSTGITDGYWALVQLQPGNHELQIGGDFVLESYYNYTTSNLVTYKLHVVGSNTQ